MVSIVVPVYNADNYLKACLTSIIEQSYSDIEVLLIDDGSTDESGTICDQFARRDARVKVFHLKNGGVSRARNYGIQSATGEFIVFVDADDCIHPKLIEWYLEKRSDEATIMCDWSNDWKVWKENHPEDVECDLRPETDFMDLYSQNYINSPWDKLYRADIVKKNQIVFPENMNLGEDLLFNLDYLKCVSGGYQILNSPLYFYRPNHDGSLSGKYRKDMLSLQIKLSDKVREYLKEKNLWEEETQKKFYGLYWDRLFLTVNLCRNYVKNGGNREELKNILRDKIWKKVYQECEKHGVMTIKRRIKALFLIWYRLTS